MERAERVAAASVFVSGVIVVIKLFVALLTGSMAVLSELLDSIGDALTSSITLIGIRFVGRPPDLDHPYGHAKLDSLLGFLSAVLLFEVGAYVIYSGLEALMSSAKPPMVTEEMLWVLLSTALVNLTRSFALWHFGGSEGLRMMQSEALNYGWDAVRTTIVAGVLLVSRDWPWIDPLAAIVAAIMLMFYVSRVAYWSARDLMDWVDPQLISRIESIIGSCKEIAAVRRVRARKVGRTLLVDSLVEVDPSITAEEAYKIIRNIEERIDDEMGPSEVLITPLASGRSKEEVVREIVGSVEGVKGAYSIELYDGGRRLHLHIILERDMSLRRIDEVANEVESKLKEAFGFEEVMVHADLPSKGVSMSELRELKKRIEGLDRVEWASVKLVGSERLEVRVGANPEMHLKDVNRLQHRVMALAEELGVNIKVSVRVVPGTQRSDTL